MSKSRTTAKPVENVTSDGIQHTEKKLRDIRRYVNGVRVTSELGEMLAHIASASRPIAPERKLKNSECAEYVLGVLSSLNLAERVDPAAPLPIWLSGDDRRFVKWGKSRPAWVIRNARLSRAVAKAIEELDPWEANAADADERRIHDIRVQVAANLMSVAERAKKKSFH